MKKILLFLILSGPIFSQRIFVTGEQCKAEYDIIYTQNAWQADICVHYVSYRHQAGRSRTRNGCDNWFFVQDIWDADLVVRVVNSIHPGRRTLRVYLDTNRGYEPPLRDRNDDYEYDEVPNSYPRRDSEYDDNYNRHNKPKIKINIILVHKF